MELVTADIDNDLSGTVSRLIRNFFACVKWVHRLGKGEITDEKWLMAGYISFTVFLICFSALTLLVWQQKGLPNKKS